MFQVSDFPRLSSDLFSSVHSVGAPKEVGMTSGDSAYPEHEFSAILVQKRSGQYAGYFNLLGRLY